jgi:phosphoglycolate phosphatase
MPNLVLFDIDGTLVLTGRAGLRAMTRVFDARYGCRDVLDGVPVAGRTDWAIFIDALARVGHTGLDEALLRELREQYLACLREEIQHRGEGVKDVMPGVRELLDRLSSRQDVWLALLTGNFAEAARIKLEHFDIWKYFRCGAFGDDAADRNLLVPVAVERARRAGSSPIPADRVFVVGDTPHDIACAHAAGAVSVGVATGGFTVDQLRQCGARIVFEDLSDTDAFLQLLR